MKTGDLPSTGWCSATSPFFFSPIAYIMAVVLYLLRAFEINGYVARAIDQQWDVDMFLSMYIMAGGGVASPTDALTDLQFADEEMGLHTEPRTRD